MKNVLICWAFIGLFMLPVSAQKEAKYKELDKKLSELLKVSEAPGFAVAVVRGNEIVYSKGYGYRNLETKEKVDENTLFAIGSTTKAFTTGLLGIMKDEKDLSFKDSPKKYLPELNFSTDILNTELTIEDLVCHRSGIPRHDFSWYLFPTTDRNEMLKRVAFQEPFSDLRTQWYYNNFGYLIQGAITEQLTGKSWEQNIRERYFIPLEMKRSNLDISELKSFSNIAIGYEWRNLEKHEALPYFNIAAMSPAGSINSSVKDMSAWLTVWLQGGKYKGKQILPLSYLAKAMNPLMSLGAGISDPNFPDQHLQSYGYAWFVSSYKGHYRLEHGGNIDGFSANVALYPTDSLGIVVLTNQDGSMVPALARDIVADFVLNLEATDWIDYHNKKLDEVKVVLANKKSSEKQIKNTHPSHALKDYQGNYTHEGYGTFRVELKNDSLYAQFPERRYYLKHWHYDVFKPFEVKKQEVDTLASLGVDMVFQMNWNGHISHLEMKLEPTLEALTFEKTALVDEKDLAKYTDYSGDYELKGIVLKIRDKGNGQLTFDVPGQPQYTLDPVGEDEFVLAGMSGYKTKFVKTKEGVMELHVIQPNGTFIAQKAE